MWQAPWRCLVPGVWGPFPEAVISDHFQLPGGLTAGGSLVDYMLKTDAAYQVLLTERNFGARAALEAARAPAAGEEIVSREYADRQPLSHWRCLSQGLSVQFAFE